MEPASLKDIRKEVKKYIDLADEKVVKMVHAMLETNSEANWWDTLPDNVKADIEISLKQAENGETLTHDEVKKKYPQWFTK